MVADLWRGVAVGQTMYAIAQICVCVRGLRQVRHILRPPGALAPHISTPRRSTPGVKSDRCTDRMPVLKQECDGLRSYSRYELVCVGEVPQWPQILKRLHARDCTGS